MPLSKGAATGAVEVIGEALAEGENVRIARVRHVHDEESSGPVRAQSAYGRERVDIGVERAGVQGGQDTQECRERRREFESTRSNRL